MVKVFDGVVIAADSATTLQLENGSHQVYNNANKVFQLHRLLPIGACTWGLGSIGSASIATLTKDLRSRLMGELPEFAAWKLDPQNYSIEQVLNRAIELFFDELYEPIFSQILEGVAQENLRRSGSGQESIVFEPPVLGFLVTGISSGSADSETWMFLITGPGLRPTADLVAGANQFGYTAYAQPEATARVFNGCDPILRDGLLSLIDPSKHAEADVMFAAAIRSPVQPAMPLVDAINLARYLVDVTIGYSNFLLGPNTVGGPVEIAAISRHEGFKWVSRKHYYSEALNPRRFDD